MQLFLLYLDVSKFEMDRSYHSLMHVYRSRRHGKMHTLGTSSTFPTADDLFEVDYFFSENLGHLLQIERKDGPFLRNLLCNRAIT